jgi:hypothetical protein
MLNQVTRRFRRRRDNIPARGAKQDPVRHLNFLPIEVTKMPDGDFPLLTAPKLRRPYFPHPGDSAWRLHHEVVKLCFCTGALTDGEAEFLEDACHYSHLDRDELERLASICRRLGVSWPPEEGGR